MAPRSAARAAAAAGDAALRASRATRAGRACRTRLTPSRLVPRIDRASAAPALHGVPPRALSLMIADRRRDGSVSGGSAGAVVDEAPAAAARNADLHRAAHHFELLPPVVRILRSAGGRMCDTKCGRESGRWRWSRCVQPVARSSSPVGRAFVCGGICECDRQYAGWADATMRNEVLNAPREDRGLPEPAPATTAAGGGYRLDRRKLSRVEPRRVVVGRRRRWAEVTFDMDY